MKSKTEVIRLSSPLAQTLKDLKKLRGDDEILFHLNKLRYFPTIKRFPFKFKR